MEFRDDLNGEKSRIASYIKEPTVTVDKKTFKNRQFAREPGEVLLRVNMHPVRGENGKVGQVEVVQVGLLLNCSHHDWAVDAVGLVLARM